MTSSRARRTPARASRCAFGCAPWLTGSPSAPTVVDTSGIAIDMASKILILVEASPVSDPRQKGELADSATSSGTCRASALTATIAVSPSGTATWTCRP